jgi:HAD superfamily hydrolase (TIGR01549 family)
MSLDISRIRALCFDVDGTLSDTDDLYVEKVVCFFPRFLFYDPQRAARRFVMLIESPGNALLGFADLVPGVNEMLARLKGRYPMAVVSARDENGTMAFLDHFGLIQYFDVIITGLSADHTKPYPDPVLLAAQKMGVLPESCLMIGDTTVDIRAGKSAGAQTVGVLCGFGEEAELKKFGADEILSDTPKLADMLLSGK